MTDKALIINVADAQAVSRGDRAPAIRFEDVTQPWPDHGINIRTLDPGQPASLYHSEPVQEDFLVLHGECLVILDGVEHQLRQWDLVHCPAHTPHVFIGAGSGRCAILMVGSRRERAAHYPVSEAAAKYGASVASPTDDPVEAYAIWSPSVPEPTEHRWPLA